ncbi:MAG: hypothetical protein LBM68_05320 [Bacteroidales bacterium]|nr:hypothetical protein [Bacteroidales bacterium]
MKLTIKTAIIALFATVATMSVSAQEAAESKISVEVGADVVSSYVWRGQYQTGASVQPGISVSGYGFTIGAWGSTDLSAAAKEVDYFVSYEIGGLSATITDYWWLGQDGGPYFKRKSHLFEASLAYSFGEAFPLSLGVNTIFSGELDKDEKGDQLYSTYISASYPFAVKDVECEVGVGVAPMKGMYTDKFDVASISAKASKSIEITDKFALPVFAELVLSPARDNAYLVFGITF